MQSQSVRGDGPSPVRRRVRTRYPDLSPARIVPSKPVRPATPVRCPAKPWPKSADAWTWELGDESDAYRWELGAETPDHQTQIGG